MRVREGVREREIEREKEQRSRTHRPRTIMVRLCSTRCRLHTSMLGKLVRIEPPSVYAPTHARGGKKIKNRVGATSRWREGVGGRFLAKEQTGGSVSRSRLVGRVCSVGRSV
jgi:hypothetical protein